MRAAVRPQAPMTAAFSAERSRSSAGTGLSRAPLWLPAATGGGSAGTRLPFTGPAASAAAAAAGGSWLPREAGGRSRRRRGREAESSSGSPGERILPGSGRHSAEPRKVSAAPAPVPALPPREAPPPVRGGAGSCPASPGLRWPQPPVAGLPRLPPLSPTSSPGCPCPPQTHARSPHTLCPPHPNRRGSCAGGGGPKHPLPKCVRLEAAVGGDPLLPGFGAAVGGALTPLVVLGWAAGPMGIQ